jgi:4-hydroxy-tetrahydrodipicolinate reductase
MTNVRLAVGGAAGRMGQTLIRTIADIPGCALAAALERPGSPALGQDAAVLAGLPARGILVSDDPATLPGAIDAILDFTTPAATVALAEVAAGARLVHVIGTTGLGAADEAAITAAAKRATIVKAGNMSLGVNLLVALTRKVAAALDNDFDIEIVEMHHRHKVDAPSGTALMLGKAAAEGRGVDLGRQSVRVRDGHTGARPVGTIGFATLRGGDVVGEHTVLFAGPGERIEVTHRATDRGIFARGAVKAALWAHGKPPGLYSMADVLGLT